MLTAVGQNGRPPPACESITSDFALTSWTSDRPLGKAHRACPHRIGHPTNARNDEESEATEFVLLDPGDLAPDMRAHPEAGLREAIDDLQAPYIDVHDDFGDGHECCAGLHRAPAATVIINGNIESGYRIGLRLALRRLEIGRHRGALTTGCGADG